MKLKKIKLHQIADTTLNERQMLRLFGGTGSCGCGCFYAGSGGSSSCDNYSANSAYGLTSPGYGGECDDDGGYGCTHPHPVLCDRPPQTGIACGEIPPITFPHSSICPGGWVPCNPHSGSCMFW